MRYVLFMWLLAAGLYGSMAPVRADAPEPTIEALKTRVAELEETIAASQPTPTKTPAPRPTAEIDPIPLTADTELLYYYAVPDSQGNAAIFGEIRNISETAVPSPYVRFTLLDDDGNIIDTIDAGPLFSFVEAGKTVPFSATYTGIGMGEWATEEIVGCGDIATDPIPEGLSIEDVRETRKEAERLQLEGKVRNEGNAPVEGVMVYAVLYRPDGRFGGSGVTLIQSPIPAGKTARFELSAYGSEMAGVVEARGTYTYSVVPATNNVAVYSC